MDAPVRSLLIAGAASCVWAASGASANAQAVPAIEVAASATATAQARPAARPQVAAAGVTPATTPAQVQGADAGGVPTTMPPPVPTISPDKALTTKQAAGVAAARKWITKFQKPRLDENGIVHFMFGRGQASVVCAVNHVCDIALEPGEVVSPPLHVGDVSDWHVHQAVSGSGGSQISHILIKPTDAGLETNIVVQTDRRTYSIEAVSRSRDYMPMVTFDYPDQDEAAVGQSAYNLSGGTQTSAGTSANPCDQPAAVPPSQFKIESSSVPWRPVQTYAVSTPVGMKLCIEFPSDINSHSLPALVALGNDGSWFSSPSYQIVNFRFVNRRFVVDGLLNRVQLVDGVGSGGQSVRIERISR